MIGPTLLAPVVLAFAVQAAAPVTIKLGTIAPDGSSWHLLLKEFGQKCSEISDGQVKLKVFAGGVAGDESDMVRKMRIGQLHAAALTVLGLRDIEPAPQALACPGLITNQAEWEHVFARVTPGWEPRMVEKGFVPLMWADTGWVYVFFSREVRTPEQAKGVKVFAWAGDPAATRGWVLAGYQPVVLSTNDILPSLATGMIEAVAISPAVAFTARFHERTKFMPEVPYGHLAGATVITRQTWERIPAELRPKIMALAREYGRRLDTEVSKLNADALTQMKKAGLKVLPLSDGEKQAWWRSAEKSWAAIRGGVCPAADFDEVKRLRDEFRAKQTAGR